MKPITTIAIVVFMLIALGHVLRMFFRWEVIVNGINIPLWASAIAVIIFVELAYMLWQEASIRK